MKRQRLYFPSTTIHFPVELAEALGDSDLAVTLMQLDALIAMAPQSREGRVWTYQTLDELREGPAKLRWIAKETLRRKLHKLKEMGLIEMTDKFNERGNDRTTWFSVNYDAVQDLLGVVVVEEPEVAPIWVGDSGVVTGQSSTQNGASSSSSSSKEISLSNTNPRTLELPQVGDELLQARLEKLHAVTTSGRAYDLKREFRPLWVELWQAAIDRGLNPKRVGVRLLGYFWEAVTDEDPDFNKLNRLVGKWGLLALEGVDAVLSKADVKDWYSYAWAVCEKKSQERRGASA